MSEARPHHHDHQSATRRILWVVLIINAAMFAIEIFAGLHAGSIALQADALDFLGDAATYAITLALLTAPIRWRAAAAFAKAASLGVFGIWILLSALGNGLNPITPAAQIMGGVGLAALTANVVSAVLLFRFRGSHANLRSVWLCSRNDALGNIAVIAAAGGVFATTTAWPDIAVGSVMAVLALSAAIQIARQARREWRGTGREVSPEPSGWNPPATARASASHRRRRDDD